jgi:bla regulator protein blaR1
MTEHLAYMVTGIGAAVGNHLWQSTVFAVSAWLMALLLRRNRAHVRYGIWLAASIKFLIPFSLLIDLGGFLRKPQHAPSSLQTTLSSAMGVVGQPFSGLPAETMNAQALPEHFTVLLPEAFAGVWLCGIVAVLLIWCMRWRKIYRALHRAVPVKSGREFALLHRLETLTKSRIHIPMLRSGDMMEPGIFGIFHPLMLWPDRLSERLENEHIEGILAHELMHVRRHDNLTAAIHMLVEVFFWFHPLVWWMESRMLEERERACDEAVVQLAGRPEVYAEGLLKACRFCAESPLICVSGITGADLKDRIVRIMTEHLVQKLNLSRKLLLGAAGFGSLAIPVAFGLVHAADSQTEDISATMNVNSPGPFGKTATASMDTAVDPAPLAVASIRQVPPRDHDAMLTNFSDVGVTFRSVAIASIVHQAFSPQPTLSMDDDLILGLPGWTQSERYDIQAKVDNDDVAKWKASSLPQRRLALQPLLVTRFSLQFHHETRERPTYSLVVAKNGPKLRKAQHIITNPTGTGSPDGTGDRDESTVTPGKIVLKGSSLSLLANLLSSQGLSHTVVDKTGLTELYDITLRWSPDDIGSSDASLPSLFTALQEQLGLKLEYNKNPIDVIVIDHIEKPSAN